MEDVNQKIDTSTQEPSTDVQFFVPRKLSEDEMSKVRGKFFVALSIGSPNEKEIFDVMFKFFAESNFDLNVIDEYKDTFWPLFVKVAWKILPDLNNDVYVDVFVRTVPHAVAEFIDVEDATMDSLFVATNEDVIEIYKKIKEDLKNSNYPVSFSEFGRNITISKLVEYLSNSGIQEDYSELELFKDLQYAIFDDENDVETVKKNNAKKINGLFRLLAYFLTDLSEIEIVKKVGEYFESKPENRDIELDSTTKGMVAANILEGLSEEESEESGVVEDVAEVAESTKVEEQKTEPEPKIEDEKAVSFAKDLSKNKKKFVGWITQGKVLRNLLGWMKSFEDNTKAREELKKLLKDNLGDKSLENNDYIVAIAHLDDFLAKNNYTGEDLFYFDEKENKFVWN
jgi:hypothetical protein